ncbi:MAG TPA: HAMP domain-containing sensor histidine kinase [Steroidobacteraceae bacterium]
MASSVLALALCVVFAFAVHQFIELLEDEMLHRTLVREMQQFKLQLETHPSVLPAPGEDMSGFVVGNAADQAKLPAGLRDLSPGYHEDVVLGGRFYFVGVEDSPRGRLYLALDTEKVDTLEGRVITVAIVVGLFALGFAAVVGFTLARMVMRPVTELADRVEHMDPLQRSGRLGNHFANREVGVIAAAFDGYMERLERVLEREQSFTEDASHELRTPLAIISSSAQLLSEEPALSAAGVERLGRIQRACSQMQSLIEALLYLARGEADGPPQTCALNRIVTESTDMAGASLASSEVEILVELEPVVVKGSPVMVASVVNNLLFNAVNYTQRGTINVTLTRDTLTVRDTGAGIPPEDLGRIFERRYRGAQSRGLGLGLYLVSRICDRLGWRIETESRSGEGTTFRIRLQSSVVSAAAESADA